MWIDVKYIIEHEDLAHVVIDSFEECPTDLNKISNVIYHHKKRWLSSQLHNQAISLLEALTSPDNQIRLAAKQILLERTSNTSHTLDLLNET